MFSKKWNNLKFTTIQIIVISSVGTECVVVLGCWRAIVLDLNWLSAFFNVGGVEINARADIIFVTTGATDGRVIFFLTACIFQQTTHIMNKIYTG